MSMLDSITVDSQAFFGFTADSKEITLPNGGKKKLVSLAFQDDDIKKILGGITEMDEFYDKNCSVNPEILFPFFKEIKSKAENGKYDMLDLVVFLSDHFKDELDKIQNMTADGKITFDGLANIFNKGDRFVSEINDKLVGGIIDGTSVYSGQFGEKYFNVIGLMNMLVGDKYVQINRNFVIPEFRGTQPIHSLTVRPMTDEELEILTERNTKFIKYKKPYYYTGYKGNMQVKTSFGYIKFNATGRVVIDYNGFKQFNPNYGLPHPKSSELEILTERNTKFLKYKKPYYYTGYKGNMQVKTSFGYIKFNATGRVVIDYNGFKQFNPNYGLPHPKSSELEIISDDMIYMFYPYLCGYSLNNKRWGEMDIDCLTDIKFDSKAFDYLVLDDEIKKLMKALVLNVNTSFSDVITGKSGGCIFLLHGPPGVGKTLSCEAISELLQKPLYSITVGELGTSPDDLEKRLGRILEIANSWEAIILLDEADIFMEKRSTNDVHRNAMVSVFLRLLERHQGVMFLTTNRMEHMDEAFRSRISAVVEYKSLDKSKRYKVWNNLLTAASIKLSDEVVNKLCDVEMNGRQIKNVIRMSQCLAKENSSEITEEIMFKVINLI